MAAFSRTGTPTPGLPRQFCAESRGAPPMWDIPSPVQDGGRGDVDFGQFPFLVVGSDEDPFEHPQVDVAQERMGLQIERLPGGLPAFKSANLRLERIRRL
jgi:hypothetical protein